MSMLVDAHILSLGYLWSNLSDVSCKTDVPGEMGCSTDPKIVDLFTRFADNTSDICIPLEIALYISRIHPVV